MMEFSMIIYIILYQKYSKKAFFGLGSFRLIEFMLDMVQVLEKKK